MDNVLVLPNKMLLALLVILSTDKVVAHPVTNAYADTVLLDQPTVNASPL